MAHPVSLAHGGQYELGLHPSKPFANAQAGSPSEGMISEPMQPFAEFGRPAARLEFQGVAVKSWVAVGNHQNGAMAGSTAWTGTTGREAGAG